MNTKRSQNSTGQRVDLLDLMERRQVVAGAERLAECGRLRPAERAREVLVAAVLRHDRIPARPPPAAGAGAQCWTLLRVQCETDGKILYSTCCNNC